MYHRFQKEELQRLIDKRDKLDSYNTNNKIETLPYDLVNNEEFDKNHFEELNENLKFEILNNTQTSDFIIIGQYNKTYIIGEWYDNFYIIDQHVAHEKILFEEFINKIKNGNILKQVIIPSIVHLNELSYSTYQNNKHYFDNCGFTIETFGDNSIIIREVPFEFRDCDAKSLILDIIQNIDNFGSGTLAEVKYDLIATKACKNAIKSKLYT